jgi:hypothetical protein
MGKDCYRNSQRDTFATIRAPGFDNSSDAVDTAIAMLQQNWSDLLI